ncbi:hypothetical protein AZE42_07283, partial [Rhizopogon vesiculosus]
QPRSLAQGA